MTAEKPVVAWTTEDLVITSGTSWLTIVQKSDSDTLLRLRGEARLVALAGLLRGFVAAVALMDDLSRRLTSAADAPLLRYNNGTYCLRRVGSQNKNTVYESQLEDLVVWLDHVTGGPGPAVEWDDLSTICVQQPEAGTIRLRVPLEWQVDLTLQQAGDFCAGLNRAAVGDKPGSPWGCGSAPFRIEYSNAAWFTLAHQDGSLSGRQFLLSRASLAKLSMDVSRGGEPC